MRWVKIRDNAGNIQYLNLNRCQSIKIYPETQAVKFRFGDGYIEHKGKAMIDELLDVLQMDCPCDLGTSED